MIIGEFSGKFILLLSLMRFFFFRVTCLIKLRYQNSLVSTSTTVLQNHPSNRDISKLFVSKKGDLKSITCMAVLGESIRYKISSKFTVKQEIRQSVSAVDAKKVMPISNLKTPFYL